MPKQTLERSQEWAWRLQAETEAEEGKNIQLGADTRQARPHHPPVQQRAGTGTNKARGVRWAIRKIAGKMQRSESDTLRIIASEKAREYRLLDMAGQIVREDNQD